MAVRNTQPHLTHVQLVKKIVENLPSLGLPHVAGKIASAQHFDIDPGIYEAAGKFAYQTFESSEFFVDSIAVPPAVPATFRIGDEPSLYAMSYDGSMVTVDQVSVSGATYRQFVWKPGSNHLDARSSFERPTDERVFTLHLTAATLGMMLSLLNSPP